MPHALTVAEPLYAIDRTWMENLENGPVFSEQIPKRVYSPKSQWKSFMGIPVASPLGVPAGPLLSSEWTTLAAKLGFDVVTYKTIRSRSHPGHPLPNVIFVQEDDGREGFAKPLNEAPKQLTQVSITNSFGMPSMSHNFLYNDIRKAKESLEDGQLLIVSVVGTPGQGEDLASDFVLAADIARQGGAQVIEANFSCPNVASKEGSLFCDADSSYKIASRLVKAIAPLPLLVKVGYYPDHALLAQVLTSLAKAGVSGVCGINSVPMQVQNEDGTSPLGKGREKSGICGDLIRAKALDFIRHAREIIDKEKLGLELAGCGGIMLPEHFDQFLSSGASIVMSATGMMWDPYLAMRWHERRQYGIKAGDPSTL